MVAEIAAVGVAAIALVVALMSFRKPPNPHVGFAEPHPSQKLQKRRRPVVRDDLAAWREEEREKYEWEAKLRAQDK